MFTGGVAGVSPAGWGSELRSASVGRGSALLNNFGDYIEYTN